MFELQLSFRLLRDEFVIAYRHHTEWLYPFLFFLMVGSLFPLGLGSNSRLLSLISPGLITIIVLLTILLTLTHLFRDEMQDGSLEQLLLAPTPLSFLIFVKLLARCLIYGFPLVIITPLLGLFFHLPEGAYFILIISLLLSIPTLIFIGAIARALTLKLRNSGFLMIVLLVPFYIPVLIFSTSAVIKAAEHLSATGELAWLGVLLLLSVSLVPFAVAAALRVGFD